MNGTARECVICGCKGDLLTIRDRLILVSDRCTVLSRRVNPEVPLKWAVGRDRRTAICRKCSSAEGDALQLLKALIASGEMRYEHPLIGGVTDLYPGAGRFFGHFRGRYAPELISLEVMYVAAVCDKFGKITLAAEQYRRAVSERSSENPEANLAVFSFVVIAHSLLDSLACWLKEAMGIRAGPTRTGIFPKDRYKAFRGELARRNAALAALIPQNDPWLAELDSRRDTITHRTVFLPIYYSREGCQRMAADPEVEVFLGGPASVKVTDYMDEKATRIEGLVTAVVTAAASP